MKHPVVDKDLTQLLRHCENDDLEPIVNIILSSPSQTLALQPAYKEHQGDHKAYIDELVYEITSFGGNSIANLGRGHGVAYGDMVREMAKKLGVKPKDGDTTPLLEEKVILKILQLSYDKLSDDDRTALEGLLTADEGDSQGIANGNGNGTLENGFSEEDFSRKLATASTSIIGDRLQHAIEIAARSVRMRQALTSVMKAALAKIALSRVSSPLSWTVAAGQAIYDLFGPNYTRALGLIAQIGLLRQKYVQIMRDATVPEMETSY